jgi:hypothetical protein
MTASAAQEAVRHLDAAQQRESFAADLQAARDDRNAAQAPDLRVVQEGEMPNTSWTPVDLAAILAGDHVEDPPAYLKRSDGPALFYAGKTHNVQGEPESCKGWFVLTAAAEVLASDRPVVYLDFEDDAPSVVGRLLALGCDRDRLAARFLYVRPDEPLGPPGSAGQAQLQAALANPPALIVIDGVTEALTIHGLDLIDNGDVAKWLTMLPRPLAATGAAVVQVDHVVKDRENRKRYAIGAQHKLAGVHCAYTLDVIEPFGRGRDGLIKVAVTKDRPGYVRQHANGEQQIALMRLASTPDSDGATVTVTLDAPDSTDAEGHFRPTVLMARISDALEQTPGMVTREIRGIKGKSDAISTALRLLIADGYVRVEIDGQAHRHYSVRPFSQDGAE